MAPTSAFVEARDQVIERLRQAAAADRRITACWLQGSLANGTADELSDIDACLAVDDAALDQFLGDRGEFCAALGMPYPGTEAGDAALRELYQQHWPQHMPADDSGTAVPHAPIES